MGQVVLDLVHIGADFGIDLNHGAMNSGFIRSFNPAGTMARISGALGTRFKLFLSSNLEFYFHPEGKGFAGFEFDRLSCFIFSPLCYGSTVSWQCRELPASIRKKIFLLQGLPGNLGKKCGTDGQNTFVKIKIGAVGRNIRQFRMSGPETHKTAGNFLQKIGKIFTAKARVALLDYTFLADNLFCCLSCQSGCNGMIDNRRQSIPEMNGCLGIIQTVHGPDHALQSVNDLGPDLEDGWHG